MTGRCGAGAALVGVALGLSLLAGCGTTDPDLAVQLLQYRRDEDRAVVQAKVTNLGESTARIERIELVAPGFDGVGPVQAQTDLAPGDVVDLPTPYGEPLCRSGSQDDATVRVWMGGRDSPVVLEPAGSAVLQRIHDRECAVAGALAAASLRWSTQWSRTGSGGSLAVEGTLVVGPVAAETGVVVQSLDGTTLFAVTTSPLPLRLGAGQTSSVQVRFEPQRCDPHAVGESKRGYAFGVRMAVDGETPDGVLVTVPPDEPGRKFLEAALIERCGLS